MNLPEKIVFALSIIVFLAVTIAISIIYFVLHGQEKSSSNGTSSTSDLSGYIYNECTANLENPSLLLSLINEDMFDYRQFKYLLSTSVISTKITLLFGFQHQTDFWGLDDISVLDTYTNDIIPINLDGNFEKNNISLFYSQCLLTEKKNDYPILSQIAWDFPHLGDCYYIDGTENGLTYLIQSFPIVGGRTYDISFWLQNNGNAPNLAVFIINS